MFNLLSIAANDNKIQEYGNRWIAQIDDPDPAAPWGEQKKIIAEVVKLTLGETGKSVLDRYCKHWKEFKP